MVHINHDFSSVHSSKLIEGKWHGDIEGKILSLLDERGFITTIQARGWIKKRLLGAIVSRDKATGGVSHAVHFVADKAREKCDVIFDGP